MSSSNFLTGRRSKLCQRSRLVWGLCCNSIAVVLVEMVIGWLENAPQEGIEHSLMEPLPQSKRGSWAISCCKAMCAAASRALVARAAVLPLVLAGCAGAHSKSPGTLWSGQLQKIFPDLVVHLARMPCGLS